MTTVNLEYVQAHLAELVDKAAQGEPFIIERGGKPLVKVTGCESAPQTAVKRTGFMRGQIQVPDDFHTMGSDEIVRLFEHGE
jgi:antitoxin (DNA-binding transcriptional repressor) of toxin-antitoxin stability system